MSRLAAELERACAELGLRIELKFKIELPSGCELHALARIPDLGAENGMLIFRSYDDVRDHASELVGAGYGYSVLRQPRPDEEFSLESFREMFSDWGWSRDLDCKPAWMS